MISLPSCHRCRWGEWRRPCILSISRDLLFYRNFCCLTGAGSADGDGRPIAPSGYRRVLLGFRRWRYFSNCSISTDTLPTCFKYHRNKLYFGTVEGRLNTIDFGFHNAASSLPTSDNGRIFSIDAKEDILVTGHGAGSVVFYHAGVCGSSLNITDSPIVFIRILSSGQTGGPGLVCWSQAGDCFLVSPHCEVNIIGRSEPVGTFTLSLAYTVFLLRFNTDEVNIEANLHNIVVINNLSRRVDLYSPQTGDRLGGFHLTTESPSCSDLTGRLLCVGFKQNIEVWDLEDIIISCQCLVNSL